MKILISFLLVLVSINAFSKTLIITDIDDTIKVAHVRSKADMIANAYVTTAPFKGMSEMFHKLLAEIKNSEIIYVTNATESLMKSSHTKFVKNNKFPAGKIYFRNESSDTHKYNTIKKYLLENPTVNDVIMLGDNGERDILFYDKIAQEFKNQVIFKTYIRIVYSSPTEVIPLAENQIGFVSPLEVLADLAWDDYLSEEAYFELADKLALEMVKEGKVSSNKPQYFPKWLNCKNTEFAYYSNLMDETIKKAYEKMETLCQ